MTQADNHPSGHLNKVSFAGLLVTLGIVFGDIGTSPLYTFSAIVGERELTETLVLGGFSAVFWTLTIQTTIKYILIVLSADNNGEGGVFSLYTLIYEKAGKGFRIETRLNYFFELALKDMEASSKVDASSRHPALEKYNIKGDIRFVLRSSFLSHENDLPFKQNFIMRSYYFLRRQFSIRENAAYGLDASSVEIENEPIVVAEPQGMKLTREA